jgi:hypothetical protein
MDCRPSLALDSLTKTNKQLINNAINAQIINKTKINKNKS